MQQACCRKFSSLTLISRKMSPGLIDRLLRSLVTMVDLLTSCLAVQYICLASCTHYIPKRWPSRNEAMLTAYATLSRHHVMSIHALYVLTALAWRINGREHDSAVLAH